MQRYTININLQNIWVKIFSNSHKFLIFDNYLSCTRDNNKDDPNLWHFTAFYDKCRTFIHGICLESSFFCNFARR